MTKNNLTLIVFLVPALIIIFVFTSKHQAFKNKVSEPQPLLYTQGSKIISSATKKPIILQGVTSDYFRYDFNNYYSEKENSLQAELKNFSYLKQVWPELNTVCLYLARLDKIKFHIEEMDQYINYARDNGIYVFLAPAGGDFLETNPVKKFSHSKQYWQYVGANDLSETTEFLSSRYGNYSNVMYYLTAEPNNISPNAWEIKQKELAEIVRKHSPHPIILSTPYYSFYQNLPTLPDSNIIYSTGGYLKTNDDSPIEHHMSRMWGDNNLQAYPIIITEFGANYISDFSSREDLTLFKEILETFHQKKLNYNVYRLSSSFENDGLALFDPQGKLTPKGKVLIGVVDSVYKESN